MIRIIAKTSTMAAAACLILSACGGDGATGPEAPLAPLQTWSFSGSEFTYNSGIAVRRRNFDGELVPGLTIWLTDQAIDCSKGSISMPARGGWIGIHYPEVSLGKGLVRVMVGSWPGGPGVNGNIEQPGSATLTKADTSEEKSVSGSLDFHSPAIDSEDDFGKAEVAGSFSVPYCPEI